MIVADASIVVEWLLRTPAGESFHQRLRAQDLAAPHLLDAEVTHALRRRVAARMLPDLDARLALDRLAHLPMDRHPHVHLLQRIWDLRHNLTPYDALYVALAEELDAPLFTADARLASAPGHSARIEVLGFG